ncbi:MAG TPA: histidine kinase dimerization/phospho-acceptor domain-containing protein [Thermoanaerobaculia bacterium]|nr:histidine kinase dimerization/phospho-acceptor domain-containing protein [Thermoanaerobaculia bacterium]
MKHWQEDFANVVFLRSSDTAHDLKTPLNIAVLNLELLRMRVRKLVSEEDDPKLIEYSGAIETELRRMARIFDTFFVLSTPPRGEGDPADLDVAPIVEELAEEAGYGVVASPAAKVAVHESRIRQALKLFLDGASNLIAEDGRRLDVQYDNTSFRLAVSGRPVGDDFEPTRIFKFYYTDPLGNPDVTLAAARLIVETYGGELNAAGESDNVSLRLTLPTR